MDTSVINLFVSIDHVLSFVEDIDRLQEKGQHFFALIEESLRLIDESGTFICKYLAENKKGTKLINRTS